MSDLNFQDLSTVQSKVQQQPVTLASADAISPTTFITKLTGTTEINTINPPVTGSHMLMLVSDALTPFGVSGNISSPAFTLLVNVPCLMFFDPASQTYFGGELLIT